ncbi:hypothetical protein HHX47_DHR3000295 [Lentinula edodes]|nr:hypothetical protein HHX47_DHR3000295 [Lentinula edodes]
MAIPDWILQLGYDGLDRVSFVEDKVLLPLTFAQGVVPDFIVRLAIRALLRQRLREIDHGSLEVNHAMKMAWIEGVKRRTTIADVPEKANEQHYEVSTKFILSTLGPWAKYSSCLFPTGNETLEEAEVLMLESYCQKAQLQDGQDVLDLGCGWGSLSLYLAQVRAYPENLHPKMFTFTAEMFEHMKNYQVLLQKISTWLKFTDSLLFIHIFCHRMTPYHFEDTEDKEGGDKTNWMAKNFFSGGTMPSHDLLLYFQDDLTLVRSWYLSGTHYSKTLEAWLKLQDQNGEAGLQELQADAKAKGQDPIEGVKAFYR